MRLFGVASATISRLLGFVLFRRLSIAELGSTATVNTNGCLSYLVAMPCYDNTLYNILINFPSQLALAGG